MNKDKAAGVEAEAIRNYREQHKRRFAEEEERLHTEPKADAAEWLAKETPGEESSLLERFNRLEDAFYLQVYTDRFFESDSLRASRFRKIPIG
jgi:hypothetical protein